MERTSGGYTLFEVLIVLAISSLLFISAFTVFFGQQRSTEFSQAMEDLRSKIQSYVAQINAGTFLDIEAYNCNLNLSDKPVLTTATGGIGTNEDCIILGRAFHVSPGTDNAGKIFVYTVLGSRSKTGGGTASTISQANPSPADDNVDDNAWLLVDEYVIHNGAEIISSKAPTDANDKLVGIYNALDSDAPESGGAASTLIMKIYPAPSDPQSNLTKCLIEEGSGCGGSSVRIGDTWNLCVSNGQRTAELSITSKPAGISTQINDKVCT